MPKPSFLRSDTHRHSRLGKNRPKLRKWRKARGRHSKIRRKHFGYPVQPGIGFKKSALLSGLVKGKRPVLVATLKDLAPLQKGGAIIISRRFGAKKRLDIMKQAQERGIIVLNVKGGMK